MRRYDDPVARRTATALVIASLAAALAVALGLAVTTSSVPPGRSPCVSQYQETATRLRTELARSPRLRAERRADSARLHAELRRHTKPAYELLPVFCSRN
jgi:hypothetical protein